MLIEVDDETAAILFRLATERGQTENEVVAEAVTTLLHRYGVRPPDQDVTGDAAPPDVDERPVT